MVKILIVDDVPDNVKLLAYLLENQGFELSLAYGGRQALELAAAESIPTSFSWT